MAKLKRSAKPIEPRRRICFVTGTRAEFGLMQTTLAAIRDHPSLCLQIIATGMHLSARHGRTVDTIRKAGWKVDAAVAWPASDERQNAKQTGRAMVGIAGALDGLDTDIVLVVGDRVEAFAAAAAGHIGGRIVAHIHGGDRALGQVDDALRHAITKLAHLHFPATKQSRLRLTKLGEDPWRIHLVGSPGIDGIVEQAEQKPTDLGRYALVLLHPTGTDETLEQENARLILSCVRRIGFDNIIIIYPNNDPGSAGIIHCWETGVKQEILFRDTNRSKFLALLRDAAVLIGNSSSGIIEAASFGTPVIDVGPRQQGRERGVNVVNVPFSERRIVAALRQIWNRGKPTRTSSRNLYGGTKTGNRVASVLATMPINAKLQRKLISY